MVVPDVPTVPDAGLTTSQVGELVAAVVKVVELALVKVMVCDPGELPPATPENESEEGEGVIAPGLVMVKVTGTVTAVAPPLIVSIAVDCPVGSPVGLTVRLTFWPLVPTVPETGETLSQDCDDVIEKVVDAVLVITIVCEGGAAAPATCEKEKEVGEAVIIAVVPGAVTVTPTEISTSDDPPVIAMVAG